MGLRKGVKMPPSGERTRRRLTLEDVNNIISDLEEKAMVNKNEMPMYIGTKLVQAEPMSRGEYNAYRGWPIPCDEDQAAEGYLVRYQPDGYESWIHIGLHSDFLNIFLV